MIHFGRAIFTRDASPAGAAPALSGFNAARLRPRARWDCAPRPRLATSDIQQ